LFAVETAAEWALVIRQPTIFLDLLPAPAQDLTGLANLSGLGTHLPSRDQVELALVSQALQPFLAEVQAQRTQETATVERHIEISLNTLIDRLQVQYADLVQQRDAPGLEGRLKQTEDRLDELNARLERRRIELAQERQCTIADVQHLGVAWVVPHPERTAPGIASMVRDDEIERIAVEAVIAYEADNGRQAVSVESENRGFDLISKPVLSSQSSVLGFDSTASSQLKTENLGEVRFIEVKGRAGVGEVAVSANEKRTAERLGRDYWLYVVYNCGGTPKVHPIQDPARLGWEAVMTVEHYRIGVVELMDAAR